jgi:FAD/FMN-containing dehydrogenase
MTTQKTIQTPGVERLRDSIKGDVLRAQDDGYDEARRVWNGMIDKRPAAIVKATDVSDVISAVNFARESGLRISVRGGGHNVSGNAVNNGGVVIDLSPMRGVRVNPDARTVRVDGGATLADVDRETQKHGLAVPLGVVSETGVAGLTSGGGLGWLRRKHGMSCDNVLAVDIVTADGHLVTASERENTDLFWAVRGGGGGFGVITSFEFRAHPLGPEVFLGFVFHPYEEARSLLQFFRQFTATAPEELGLIAFAAVTPEHDPFPAESQGRRAIAFAAVYVGAPEDGERMFAPIRTFTTPLADFSSTMPYVEAQAALDEDYPAGRRYYWKSTHVRDLDDELIDLLVTKGAGFPSPLSTLDIWHMGGAIQRPASSNAFGAREGPYVIGIESNWIDPRDDEANIAWARDVYAAVEPFSTGERYLNFPGFFEEGQELARAAAGAHFERLLAIKKQHDPSGLFKSSSE